MIPTLDPGADLIEISASMTTIRPKRKRKPGTFILVTLTGSLLIWFIQI